MQQPDIEIYVKDSDPETLISWLSSYFSFDKQNLKQRLEAHWNDKKSFSYLLQYGDHEVPLFFTPNAAGKAYRSIWFQSTQTPWADDKKCAISLLEYYDGEVRCSESSWTEDEQELSEKWWVLTRTKQTLVPWG